MHSDDLVWDVINTGFCSFKVKTDRGTLCRNENNVTGQCNRMSCPLANSRYATVREIGGAIFLFKKVVERAHMPARLWERIKLRGSAADVEGRIDRELEYMPAFYRAKCKARYARYTEYLRRVARLAADETQPVLSARSKKVVRREASREARARKVARIEASIERELVERLQKGVYGEIYNLPQRAFDAVLDKHGVDAEQEASEEELEVEYVEADSDAELVDDFEASEEEIEDVQHEIEYDDGKRRA